MATLEEAWQTLLDGGPAPTNPHLTKLILVRIRNEAAASDEAQRLDALRVARAMGDADALRSTATYVRDPSLDVRKRLLSLAREAGSDGVALLRQLVTDPDPHLAVAAVRQLTLLEDRSATPRVKGLLDAEHGIVRNRAAVFLGLFGGPSLVPLLERHAEDEDQEARRAIAWAIDRLEGRTEAPPPETGASWAGPEAAAIEDEAARRRREEAQARPDAAPAAPEAAPEAPPALDPEPAPAAEASQVPPPAPASPALPVARTGPSPEPSDEAPAPTGSPTGAATDADVDADVTDEAAEERPIADDGSGLPVDATVLEIFRALATFPDRRSILVERLRAAPERELSAAFRGRRPGEHPDVCAGAALAAADLGNPRWLSPVRKLAGDPEPRVRAAVAEALGALATPAVFRNLEGLAVDSDATVQAAGVRALATGASRLGWGDQARRLIEALPETKDQALLAARNEALAALSEEAGA